MKLKILLILFFITFPIVAQVGIGTITPHNGAVLDVSASDKSLLITRVANTAAITNPTNGMIIYDIAQACVKVYQNGAWSDCITNNGGGGLNSLNCAGANVTGSIYQGIPVTNVSAIISYTGGNGGIYNGQTVNSTGVLGLTAVCGNGSFASGNGALIFTITGTATSFGVASFAITIGGQTCTLNITILQAPVITGLNCAGATHNGALTVNQPASGVSTIINYTGGNGGSYAGQTINSSGITGLTATLAPGTLATGAGSLTFIITGTPTSSGTASFSFTIGGQSCTFTRNTGGIIASLNCAGATHTGTLIQGTAASGVSSTISYTGGNGGNYAGQTISSTGVTGLTATLTAGTFATGAGSVIFTITGTPASTGTASFVITLGGQICTFTRTVTNVSYASLSLCSAGSISCLNTADCPSLGAAGAGSYYLGGISTPNTTIPGTSTYNDMIGIHIAQQAEGLYIPYSGISVGVHPVKVWVATAWQNGAGSPGTARFSISTTGGCTFNSSQSSSYFTPPSDWTEVTINVNFTSSSGNLYFVGSAEGTGYCYAHIVNLRIY